MRARRIGPLVLALVLLGALAGQASAAIPSHSRAPSLDAEGLNHACGVAVDTEGDLYAASAGEGKVKIFGPADHETPIGEIANANEPCALALTSTGNLYVSEKATGEVVRYVPTEYPFVNPPSYGPPEVIDSSGEAKGIAVDPFDDRLYVAAGTRVSAYDKEGKLGVNEAQAIRCFNCSSGTFKLIFNGEETDSIPFEGPAKEFEDILLKLGAFDPGDISVAILEESENRHLVTFAGNYAHTDVEAFTANESGIEPASAEVQIAEEKNSFDGQIGEGELSEATGVAPYTHEASSAFSAYHLAVADAAGDQLKLFSAGGKEAFKKQQLRRTLDGASEGEEFGFGAKGAYLASDPGSCPPAEQACAAGHLYLYDDGNEVLDEFEATGELVSQTPFAFGDGAPTQVAVDRSTKAGNGTLYATTGAGAGARALAFSPLKAPARPGPEEPPLSLTLAKACSVAVDDYGNRYVAVGPEIFVYGPASSVPLAKIAEASGAKCRIAVDGEGNVYSVLEAEGETRSAYFKPSSYPPKEGTSYGKATIVAKSKALGVETFNGLAVDSADDHLLLNSAKKTFEYGSAAEGSPIVNPEFAPSLSSVREAVAACAKNGHVFIAVGDKVKVFDAEGKEELNQITGAGSPGGTFGAHVGAIAVDQSNCHLIAFETGRALREYEESGAFVAEYGASTKLVTSAFGVAVDNGSESPNAGSVYLAFDEPNKEVPYDLFAFGGLGYGARLSVIRQGPGTVTSSPAGIDCGEECSAEYVEGEEVTLTAKASAAYEGAEFKGWGEGDCDSEPSETECTVKMDKAREVRASFTAPPLAVAKPPVPVTYTEATLRGEVDPAGVATEYHFAYLTQAAAEQNEEEAKPPFSGAKETPTGELAPAEGLLAVKAHLSGLAKGTGYRFALIASNEAGLAEAEGSFATLAEPPASACPNAAYRTGPAAKLPDCRAYELVTPGYDNGYAPGWAPSGASNGNFATQLAASDGQSLVFETPGVLPGTEGNLASSAYRAQRDPGGWGLTSYGPSAAEVGSPFPGGVAADHGYSFWAAGGLTGSLHPEEGFSTANYLALSTAGADPQCAPKTEPAGRFALIGCGEEGKRTDPGAFGRFISPGAGHVIFTSAAQLEPNAPAKGTTAIYDRSPGGPTHVVSLLPGEETPSEAATYRGVSADGSAVAFSIGETLYVRRDNAQTLAVSDGPATFAGLSGDGERVFYADQAISLTDPMVPAAGLFACDLQAGPCAGPGAHEAAEIAADGIFVNVAAEGTRAYFTSTEASPAEQEEGAEEGADNLYLWDASDESTRFVARLDHGDVSASEFEVPTLARWLSGLDPDANGVLRGPAMDPSRSSADGGVLLFESHAPLTGYESGGHSEVFRYEATGEGSLACLSCGAAGTVAKSDAKLQHDEGKAAPDYRALAPNANLSEDGSTAFFTSAEPLAPADKNGLADVYEWRDGTLSLISTGTSRYLSILYAVSATGEDVFFVTREALVPGDEEEASLSIYDARVGGGFVAEGEEGACEGEVCRGAPSANPAPGLLPPPTASLPAEGVTKPQARHCPKGKRKVRRHGKVRCVKAKKHKRHNKHAKKGKRGKRRGGRAAR